MHAHPARETNSAFFAPAVLRCAGVSLDWKRFLRAIPDGSIHTISPGIEMKTLNRFTWLTVLGIAAGCAFQKAQQVKTDRLARKAAGEGGYERTHPKPGAPVMPAASPA